MIKITEATLQLIITKEERKRLHDEIMGAIMILDDTTPKYAYSADVMRKKYPMICELLNNL